jgi:hypothetical protein
MKLRIPAKNILLQLEQLLEQLDDSQYISGHDVFNGSTIGQHTRHIIEFFECVLTCDADNINYDLRNRDQSLEKSTDIAIDRIQSLNGQLIELADRAVMLNGEMGSHSHQVVSTIERELLYTIEHAVHHMAIIKIGLLVGGIKVDLPAHFGVADSTIKYMEG